MSRAPSSDHTDTLHIEGSRAGPVERHHAIHVALCGAEPLMGSAAFDLSGVEELTIGRGSKLALLRDEDGGWRMEVPDSAISKRHARLRLQARGGASLEDLGSRNGTHLRGQVIALAPAHNGDSIVIGRTGFILREVDHPVAREPERVSDSAVLATFMPGLAREFRRVADLARSKVPMLLLGETGTGKEVVANEIHALSSRKGALVAVNCAALPETLVESELFGYRRGAFSDAREDRTGLIRASDKGTLFLDEIGELELTSQAKLLRVLQEGEVMPLGSTAPVSVDVRVVAASQRRLEDLVAAGEFRPDLAGRLAGFTLSLPRLAERLEDLGLLVAALLERYAGDEAPSYRITASACGELLARRWRYNVRELARVLEVAVTLAHGDREISLEHLGKPPTGEEPGDAAGGVGTDELRAELLLRLRRSRGNVSAVAREMGKARMQIHRWLERYGLRAEDFRHPE